MGADTQAHTYVHKHECLGFLDKSGTTETRCSKHNIIKFYITAQTTEQLLYLLTAIQKQVDTLPSKNQALHKVNYCKSSKDELILPAKFLEK